MKSKRSIRWLGMILPLILSVACDQPPTRLTAPGGDGSPTQRRPDFSTASTTIPVTDVEQLYAAVNDPANEGAAVMLAPGTYVLSATDGEGIARLNGGRLELQRDMSLVGVTNDRAAAVIDGSGLPASSFTVSFGRTGVIRVGRGSNTIEWLTVLGNPAAAAGIATELLGTSSTQIRVAHVSSGGSSRGLDVRNVGAAMSGRRIDAEIIDNDLSGPTSVVGMSEGIRVANFVGANAATIVATLRGNRTRDFQLGCIFANNRTNGGVIDVRSYGDRFTKNALGCLIAGGLNQSTSGVANLNSTTFTAYGCAFVDNTAQIAGIEPGGIRVAGGLSTVKTNATSDNTVTATLVGCKVEDNQVMDFEAFGAIQYALTGLAGTNNHATITLRGVSKQIDVIGAASSPVDPGGTNTLTVIR